MTEAEYERWACGRKCRYTSRRKAIIAGRRRGHMRVYRCYLCHGWHLTSRTTSDGVRCEDMGPRA